MRFNRWTVANINKVAMVINALRKVENFNADEFTQKEFDKLFKGNKSKPSGFSLSWLRDYGVDNDGDIRCASSWGYPRREVTRFVTIAREEQFEVPNKTTHEKGYALADENGNILKGYNADDFNYPKMRALIEEKFGKVHLVEVDKPIMGKRYFYRIDLDALNRVAKCSDEIAKYYEYKILKMSTQLEKYQKALDLVSAMA